MNTQGYYSSSSSSSSTKSPNQNLRNNIVSPMTSPNESMLMRYLRSGLPPNLDYSPSPKQSRPVRSSSGSCRTPFSVVENLEDDVIVMDGILVDSTKTSKSVSKFRYSPGNSSSSSNSAVYRERAHGQEEIRQILLSQYYDKEYGMNDPYYSPGSSMYSSGSSKFAYETMASPSPAKEAANLNFKKALSTLSTDASTFSITDPYYSPLSSTQSSSGSSTFASKTKATPPPSTKEVGNSKFNIALPIQSKDTPTVNRNLTSTDWSPLDDGITVQLPFSRNDAPSRKAVDEHIHIVLYGPTTQKKRLPVFIEICPE